jgi:hypothetical protein
MLGDIYTKEEDKMFLSEKGTKAVRSLVRIYFEELYDDINTTKTYHLVSRHSKLPPLMGTLKTQDHAMELMNALSGNY